MTTCPQCRGLKTYVRLEASDEPDDDDEPVLYRCEACKGSGVISTTAIPDDELQAMRERVESVKQWMGETVVSQEVTTALYSDLPKALDEIDRLKAELAASGGIVDAP